MKRVQVLAATVLLCAGAAADDTFDTMAPPPDLSRGSGDVLSKQQARDLARDLRTALCDADRSAMAAPPAACAPESNTLTSPPDANYVRILRQSFETARRATSKIPAEQPFDANTDPIAARYMPAAGETLIANATYDANLRKLYLQQLKTLDGIASGKLAAGSRIIGGSQIPQAKDVVLISDVLAGPLNVPCTGTIITPTGTGDNLGTAILTAAHCVCDWTAAKKGGALTLSVRVGQDATDDHEYKAYLVRSKIELMNNIQCPADGYDIPSAITGPDLAVITTDNSISSDFAEQRAILSPNAYAAWKSGANRYFVRVGGYGPTSAADAAAKRGVRYFADMAIASYDCNSAGADCRAGLEFEAGGAPIRRVANSVNDPKAGSVSTTKGDSGGPVYASFSAANPLDKFYLVGVTQGADYRDRTIATQLTTNSVMCWLAKVTNGRAKFVLADGTTDPGSGQCAQ